MINKTLIIAIALVGVILVSGCVQQATNNTNTNQTQATATQVSGEINQQLLDENQTTVEIGDMV